MTAVTKLQNQFFADCERESVPPNEGALRAWLWFTGPAHSRFELRSQIERDSRYVPGGTLTTLHCTRCGNPAERNADRKN